MEGDDELSSPPSIGWLAGVSDVSLMDSGVPSTFSAVSVVVFGDVSSCRFGS